MTTMDYQQVRPSSSSSSGSRHTFKVGRAFFLHCSMATASFIVHRSSFLSPPSPVLAILLLLEQGCYQLSQCSKVCQMSCYCFIAFENGPERSDSLCVTVVLFSCTHNTLFTCLQIRILQQHCNTSLCQRRGFVERKRLYQGSKVKKHRLDCTH